MLESPRLVYFETNPRDLVMLRTAAAACNVMYAVNGFSELEAAKDYLKSASLPGKERFQFLLADVSLLAQEGLALARWVRSEPSLHETALIMCSSQHGHGIVKTCYAAGADYFLAKPESYSRLKQMLQKFDACLYQIPLSFKALEKVPEYRPPAFRDFERFVAARMEKPLLQQEPARP
jgi:CheY-like chemotaxis protein